MTKADTEEEYSLADLAAMWAAPYSTVARLARTKGIPRHRKGTVIYIWAEDAMHLRGYLAKFKERRGPYGKRKPQTSAKPAVPALPVATGKKEVFWRVSVFDGRLGRFIVLKCSLTREEAEFEKTVLELSGFIARKRPCASQQRRKKA